MDEHDGQQAQVLQASDRVLGASVFPFAKLGHVSARLTGEQTQLGTKTSSGTSLRCHQWPRSLTGKSLALTSLSVETPGPVLGAGP